VIVAKVASLFDLHPILLFRAQRGIVHLAANCRSLASLGMTIHGGVNVGEAGSALLTAYGEPLI
jgi:hypothetical protein